MASFYYCHYSTVSSGNGIYDGVVEKSPASGINNCFLIASDRPCVSERFMIVKKTSFRWINISTNIFLHVLEIKRLCMSWMCNESLNFNAIY